MKSPAPCRAPRQVIELSRWRQSLQHLGDHPRDYKTAVIELKSMIDKGFNEGCYIDDLLKDMTQGIDAVLVRVWESCELAEADCALIAVGGYGRAELHPGSDIDILILLGSESDHPLEDKISRFFTFLWDLQLDLGNSVRTVQECLNEGAADITIATTLFESRLLTGPDTLYAEFKAGLSQPGFWDSKTFFEGKIDEQHKRHKRFGDSGYRVEPNLKESPGGLRDLHIIAWVIKRHFGVATLQSLVGEGFITEQEYDTICLARNLLWQIRHALHRLTGRKEDRLLFAHQKTLADEFGFEDKPGSRAVEQFMQRYFLAITDVQRIGETLLQLFDEEVLLRDQPSRIEPLNEHFQTANGYLHIRSKTLFEQHPPALLELFRCLQQSPELRGVGAVTIRAVRTYLPLIDDEFRDNPECRQLFMDILSSPRKVYHQLQRMNTYGVLAAYLPVFGNIVGRMQFDLFHAYTVDEHTLMVLRYARRLATAEYRHELPQCSEVFQQLKKPHLLYIAALFHDIGKGRGGDHSKLGAVDAEIFCTRHGLDADDTSLIIWLVYTHLLMSTVAQRKDISDPDVIRDFTAEVKTKQRLQYLYLLTVSDIRGTNPTLWNDWKASLLAQLYRRSIETLEHQDSELTQAKIIVDNSQAALQLLSRGKHLQETEILAVWDGMGSDYFRHQSAESIAWHTRIMLKHCGKTPVSVDILPHGEHGSTEILVYAKAHPRFFSMITRGIEHLGLNILDARIHTIGNGRVLDTFHVLDNQGQTIDSQIRIQDIKKELLQLISHPEQDNGNRIPLSRPRQLKSLDTGKTQIEFTNPRGKPYTEMSVSMPDRPGLLADIATTLFQEGIRIQLARIATVSEQAEDILHITDSLKQPLNPPQQQALKSALLQAQPEVPE